MYIRFIRKNVTEKKIQIKFLNYKDRLDVSLKFSLLKVTRTHRRVFGVLNASDSVRRDRRGKTEGTMIQHGFTKPWGKVYLHRDPTVDHPTSFLFASRLPIAMPLTVISLCLYYDRPYRLDWKNYICRLEAIFQRSPPKVTTATASFLLVRFVDLLVVAYF